MMPMTRSRTVRWLGALIGAAALGAALPAPALARERHHDQRGDRHDRDHGRGHRDRGDRDHDRGHRYASKHDRHDGGRHHARHAPHFRPAPRNWHGGHRHHSPAYYCGRCRSHFASYHGLYGHVHHHHHVPTWRVPGLLAQVSFGWAFGL